MRNLILILTLMLLTAAQTRVLAAETVVTSRSFLNEFSQDDEITRAGKAFELCNSLLNLWQSPDYISNIQFLGSAWNSQPEAAYYALNTCQTMWIARYLDPLKAVNAETAQDHARLAFYFANLDLVHLPRALREEIRIYAPFNGVNSVKIPQAPYELLTGMQSSERLLDQTIRENMQNAFRLAAVSAGAGMGLRVAKALTSSLSFRANALAKVSKTAIIAALVAGAALEATNGGIWYYNQSQLRTPLAEITRKLMQTQSPAPTPVLLNEFYRFSERLGYFYNYDLFSSESGRSEKTASVNKACASQIETYFRDGDSADARMAHAFTNQNFCPDAVSLWIGAAEFLRQRFPSDVQARLLT